MIVWLGAPVTMNGSWMRSPIKKAVSMPTHGVGRICSDDVEGMGLIGVASPRSRLGRSASRSPVPVREALPGWAFACSLGGLDRLQPGRITRADLSSHAPVATAATDAGLHVLVEKPRCLSVAEDRGGDGTRGPGRVALMVGYTKRYDAAYSRMCQEVEQLDDLNLVRVTTLESPFEPYLSHHQLIKAQPLPPELRSALDDDASRVRAAIGDTDPLTARAYRWFLLQRVGRPKPSRRRCATHRGWSGGRNTCGSGRVERYALWRTWLKCQCKGPRSP